MALGDIYIRFTWQAWHKLTSTVVLRGRRGTYGTGWRAWSGFVACDAQGAVPLCVAGVALGEIHLDITWQAGHLVTSTFVSRGRCGTNSHPPSFCVAGVALMVLGGALGPALSPVTPGAPCHFAWQAWHLVTSTLISRGRRGAENMSENTTCRRVHQTCLNITCANRPVEKTRRRRKQVGKDNMPERP